jgi:uncharacterized iron-regulated membrane protein
MFKWIKGQYHELRPYGRFFFGLGIVSLVVAVGMTFTFGLSMSVWHAFGLGVLSVVAAFLPEAAYRLREDGHIGLAALVLTCALPLLTVEYFSHIGYTVGQRVTNVEQTGVKNTIYDDQRAKVEENRANLERWKASLEKLRAENPWAVTVTDVALRAELESKQKAIDLEAARGGCKSICLKRMEEKADLERRIALAEEAGKLGRQIEATQKIVDQYRDKANSTELVSSPVVNQTAWVAKAIAWDLNPDAGTKEGSQIGISASLALANVLLTPLCLLIAGRHRYPRRDEDEIEPLRPAARPETLTRGPEALSLAAFAAKHGIRLPTAAAA